MQRTEIINRNRLFNLIEFIFSDEKVELYESYSKMEEELIQISDFNQFETYLYKGIEEGQKKYSLAIYYLECKGLTRKSKIELNPKYCDGKTFRYRIDGWGLIFMNLNFKNEDKEIECNISVNSKTRAKNWESINPEFGNPELWDWKFVESKTRKIINKLKNQNERD